MHDVFNLSMWKCQLTANHPEWKYPKYGVGKSKIGLTSLPLLLALSLSFSAIQKSTHKWN